MSHAHSDHGTVLKPDQAAITWSTSDGFNFLMPNYEDDQDVPDAVVALAHLAMKLHDDLFVRQLVEEFRKDPVT